MSDLNCGTSIGKSSSLSSILVLILESKSPRKRRDMRTVIITLLTLLLWVQSSWAQVSIQSVTPITSPAISLTATDDGSCTTTNTGCAMLVIGGYTGISLQVTGTWVGTIQFEASLDGSTWVALSGFPANSTTAASSTTGNGMWNASVIGARVRARFSAYTSGTAVVTIRATLTAHLNNIPPATTDAPTNATYLTQTPNATLTNEQAMSALATGLVKNTTTTGVQSIAAQGTDYYAPGGTDVAVADGGTNLSSYAVGAILHASGATTLAGLADVAVGQVLVSGGVGMVPAYSATPTVTTLDTGQGAKELYAMDQDVLTTSTPQFSRGGYGAAADATALLNLNGAMLTRDAANILAQRNGTNAQEYRIYNTFTDTSNYIYGGAQWSGGTLYLQTNGLGTGSAGGSLALATGNAKPVEFWTNNIKRWTLSSSGALSNTARTLTASDPTLVITDTWNNGAVSFIGQSYSYTETASAAGSRYVEYKGGAAGTTDEFYIGKGGTGYFFGAVVGQSFESVSQTGTGASGYLYFLGRSQFQSPANNRVSLTGSSGLTGFEFKTDTDGTVKFRARGDGSDAALTAGAATFSGNELVSGTVTWSATIPAAGAGDTYICMSTTFVVHTGVTCAASSELYKDNIQPIAHGLDWLRAMRPVSFTWNADSGRDAGKLALGLIAEDMDRISPLLSVRQDGAIFSINDRAVLATTIKAVQELAEEVEQLKAKVN